MAKNPPTDESPPPEPSHSYVSESRTFSMSVLMILPLLVAYQIGIVHGQGVYRNMAGVWVMNVLASTFGAPGPMLINVIALIGFVFCLGKLQRMPSRCVVYAIFMVAESLLYALFMRTVLMQAAGFLDDQITPLLAIGWQADSTQLLLFAGAGVYEEFVFRFLMLGGLYVFVHKYFMWNKLWSGAFALTLSTAAFVAAHHIVPAGEPANTYTVLFRGLAGLTLGLVFLTRGLGVAVWSHALYNVLTAIGP